MREYTNVIINHNDFYNWTFEQRKVNLIILFWQDFFFLSEKKEVGNLIKNISWISEKGGSIRIDLQRYTLKIWPKWLKKDEDA